MRRATAVLFCLACLPAAFAGEPSAEAIPWITSVGEAMKDAAAAGRPTFVDVWATWCVPCRQMDVTTYRDPEVVARLRGPFTALKVDADAQPLFIERYRVEAYPTALVLDEKGEELVRYAGALTAAQLLGLVDRVAADFETYRLARDAGDRLGVADVLLRVGNPDGAAELYRRALKGVSGPPAGRALAGLYRAEMARGRPRDAARVLERLRKEAPDQVPADLELGTNLLP